MTNPASPRTIVPYAGAAIVVVCAAYFGFLMVGVPGIVAVLLLGALAVLVAQLRAARASRRRVPPPDRAEADRRTALTVAGLGAGGAVLAALVTALVPVLFKDDVPAAATSAATPGASAGHTASPSPSAPPSPSSVPWAGPGTDCLVLDVDVDQYGSVGSALAVGYQVNLTGQWQPAYDGGKLWIFVTGGGTNAHFPYVGEIVRDGGRWVAWGIPLGRKEVAADAKMGVRTLEVIVATPEQDKQLRKQVDAADFWTRGGVVQQLPAGAASVARIPVDRVC
ncbi:hypothetical protein CS0771_35810 [Catellatospora sp. IY07-71]|uniref:hypothetical protein n=1 Tax=Catellatospora sp. IY07-71 TaxID=2728827 RepID=UPI001BB2FCBE|nr:hypothetical protein [Catellatospora sp. IY07-71]BCJ74037.1 hypothetical protein CS0771_35810 [Catellatospora sp. IY07-71]